MKAWQVLVPTVFAWAVFMWTIIDAAHQLTDDLAVKQIYLPMCYENDTPHNPRVPILPAPQT